MMTRCAENSENAIDVFTPAQQNDPSSGYSLLTTFKTDYAGNAFSAPGAIPPFATAAGDYTVVGAGGQVLLYLGALNAMSVPLGKVSSSGCSSAPNGPTGFAVKSPTTGVSDVYISSFYNGVVEYSLTSVSGTGTCPTPAASTTSGTSTPEGVAIDASGNVFVSNAGNSTITAYNSVLGAQTYTYPP